MKKIIYSFSIILIFISALQAQKKELTVKDIFASRAFSAASLRGVQWFDAGNKYSFLKAGENRQTVGLYSHDCLTGEESLILTNNDLKLKAEDKPFSIQNYTWSPDGNYILFTGMLPARTLKTGGAFYIYELKTKKFFLLAQSELEQSNARFSPDSKKLGFVRGNNLFVVDIATDKEKQLTFDGSPNILNGKFDWVYEEEFSIIDGWEWSPDSRNMAYWRMDQTLVPEVQIAEYDSLYFNFLKYKYPKPGAHNSVVKIGVVNTETGKSQWMDIGAETDIYIPRIKFTNDPKLLSIQRLNRLQNKLDFLFCDITTGSSKVILTDSDPSWIDIFDDVTFLKDGKSFIWSSEKDGFKHLYLYDMSGKEINQITKGKWEVSSLLSVNEKNKTVYYMSNETGRRFKDLYSISFDGSNKKRLTPESGVHRVSMSSNSAFYIDRYSDVNTMATTVLCNADGSRNKTLLEPDMSGLKDFQLAKAEFFGLKTSDGYELDAYMVKPLDFDASKKYPVIVMNYNGPGSQYVNDSWGSVSPWDQLLVQKGYIIVGVDCRITGGRGAAFKALAYKNLGHWEVNDLIETAKYLGAQGYVDASRIGIWGWSYGGYTSASTILRAADYFKTAIAVAPVTHWKFYDSIYAERYMSLPELNPKGYEESAVLNYADKLKGKFLLIHGMADDNVHFQNSVELVNKLIEADKQFRVMYYPGRDHGIYGGNTTLQLYQLMTDFFVNNL